MSLCFACLSGFVAERSGRSGSGRARLHGLAPGGSPRALVHPAEPAARWGGETPAGTAGHSRSPAAPPGKNSPSFKMRLRAAQE